MTRFEWIGHEPKKVQVGRKARVMLVLGPKEESLPYATDRSLQGGAGERTRRRKTKTGDSLGTTNLPSPFGPRRW